MLRVLRFKAIESSGCEGFGSSRLLLSFFVELIVQGYYSFGGDVPQHDAMSQSF